MSRSQLYAQASPTHAISLTSPSAPLVDNGVPAQFIAYPVTGHSPSDPIHSRDIDRHWIAWLGRYLAPRQGVTCPPTLSRSPPLGPPWLPAWLE